MTLELCNNFVAQETFVALSRQCMNPLPVSFVNHPCHTLPYGACEFLCDTDMQLFISQKRKL